MADSNFVNKVKKSNAVYNIQDQRIENISSLSTATNAVNGSGKSVKIGTGLYTLSLIP